MNKLYILILCYFSLIISQEIVDITPSSANAGTNVTVSITGSNTNFTVDSSTGTESNISTILLIQDSSQTIITGSNINTLSETLLEVNFSIPASASEGTYDLGINPISGNSILTEDAFLIELEIEDLSGDVNQDGIVNVLDIVLIVDFVINSEYNELGDVNNDGILNVLDIVEILNIIF